MTNEQPFPMSRWMEEMTVVEKTMTGMGGVSFWRWPSAVKAARRRVKKQGKPSVY